MRRDSSERVCEASGVAWERRTFLAFIARQALLYVGNDAAPRLLGRLENLRDDQKRREPASNESLNASGDSPLHCSRTHEGTVAGVVTSLRLITTKTVVCLAVLFLVGQWRVVLCWERVAAQRPARLAASSRAARSLCTVVSSAGPFLKIQHP